VISNAAKSSLSAEQTLARLRDLDVYAFFWSPLGGNELPKTATRFRDPRVMTLPCFGHSMTERRNKGDCVIVNKGVRWRAVHAAANTLGPSLQ
jgi:hypothetical protein